MDYKQALEEALAAVNAQTAQQQREANIEAGNAAYDKLAEEADTRRSIERQRLAKRMAEMGIAAPQSLTIQNNSVMAGYSDIGDISRQNQRYTGMQNAMKEQAYANAAAQAARITADMNAAENASELEDTNNRFDMYYRMYMAKKMTRSQFKKKTGMDVRGWAARRKAPQKPQDDLRERGYSDSRTSGGQISPPVYIQPDLRQRGYADSRTSGGQISQSRSVNADTKDGAVSVNNVPEEYTGKVIGPVQSKKTTMERTGLGIRLNPTADYEKSKTIIKNAQSFGIADRNLDVESLTPIDAAREAQNILNSVSKAAEAYENYRKIGAPYPGAPKRVSEMTVDELDDEIARIRAELGIKDSSTNSQIGMVKPIGVYNLAPDLAISIAAPELAKQADYLEGLEIYRTTAVRNEALYPPPQTLAENDARIQQIEEQKAQMENGSPDYWKNKKDCDIKINALKQNRPWVQQLEDKTNIEQDITNRPDFWQVVEAAKKEPARKDFNGRMLRGDIWNLSEPYTGQAIEERGSGILAVAGKYYTAEEKNIMTYLYQKGEDEKLDKYQGSLDHIINERRTLSDQAFVRKTFEGDDGWEKARLIFGSFVEMPNSVAALGESGYNWIAGQPTDPYSQAQQMAARPQYIRNETLVKATPLEKRLGGLGYNMGDMLVTLPFGSSASLAIMASEAGGQEANSIVQRGGSSEQAFWGGLAVAATEIITEKIPLDNLFKMAKSGTKLFSVQGLKNMLKQGGMNMGEEWVSEVANGFTDYAIMGDRSQLGMRINELINQGVSVADAQKQAFNDQFVVEPLYSAAGGFISGEIFSGGGMVIGNTAANARQKTQTKISQDPVSPAAGQTQQTTQQHLNVPLPETMLIQKQGIQDIINQQQAEQQGQTEKTQNPGTSKTQTVPRQAGADASNEGSSPLIPTNIDPNADVALKVQNSVINATEEIKLRAEETQSDIYNDSVKNAYYQFRINPTNATAEAFYNTSIQNIDTAITAGQQAGADISALAELKGKMESGKSEAGQAQPDAETQAKRAAIERNMTKAVSALTNLPAEVQAGAETQAARQTLYDYLKADENGKAAAYDKAGQQLSKSISSALAEGGLDAGTRQTLEGMLDNIDSRGEMGDNNKDTIDFDLVKKYIQDIKQRTGMKIPKNQIEELKNALRNKEYRKISKKELHKHRNEFNNIRDDLISQWEKKTGQKWPVYKEDVISAKNGEPYKKAGQYYDAHHIIECSYGGDNAWWNIHPARNPDIHQSGIHGTGSPASRLFDGGNYDY